MMITRKKNARMISLALDDVRAGIVSLEELELNYPDIVEEIKAELALIEEMAKISFFAEKEINPREQKVKLLQKLPDRGEIVTNQQDSRYRVHNLKRRFGMTWVVIVATVLSLISGARAVYASSDALPGDILYPVKMWTENVQLAIAPDDADMGLYLQFTQERVEEAAKLIGVGRAEDLDEAVSGYQNRTEFLNQFMQRIQADDPEEAVRLRLLLEEKLQEQARIMQSFVDDGEEIEIAGDQVREQLRLMLETNIQLRLRINEIDDTPVDDLDDPDEEVEMPLLDDTAITDPEEVEDTNGSSSTSFQVNNGADALMFGLGGKGIENAFAVVNGTRFDCIVENDLAICEMPKDAPQRGNVNLYDGQNNELLYSYSYEFDHDFDYSWDGTKESDGNNGEHFEDDTSGKETNKNEKGN